MADRTFARAVELKRAGRIAGGFVQLGRVAHLLADMACPNHVHRVWHLQDPFEWWVESHAPMLSTLLFLVVFAHALSGRVNVYENVSYEAFLVPGLAMMANLQNAFANTSSSLVQSKMSGNIVFMLLPPIAYFEFFAAYVIAAIVRGLAVAVGVLVVGAFFVPVGFAHPLWVLFFAFAGAATLGALGLIAGIWADKVDQLSAFQNFVILPATFLSGVFYSIHSLSPFWQGISHLNPIFYMIDGFRYGFFGVADVSPWLSLGVVALFFAALSAVTVGLLKSGYKLRY